jgi:hypothetical protein
MAKLFVFGTMSSLDLQQKRDVALCDQELFLQSFAVDELHSDQGRGDF